LSPSLAYALLVSRQDIFTAPPKAIQARPAPTEINNPTATAPPTATTHCSSTHFSSASDCAGRGSPGRRPGPDAVGTSVLTPWAAGKFDASVIAKGVKNTGVADKIAHRRIIIPGQVAVLSGELEEELPGWEIKVGPREAVDLPGYLKVMAN